MHLLAPMPLVQDETSTQVDRPRSTRIASSLVGAVVAGVALGFATQILQGRLSGSSAVLANSGVVWALAAFGLGLIMPSSRSAVFGGAVCLIAASLSYYVFVDGFHGLVSAPRGPAVWSIAGIVAGSSFGFAGYAARYSQRLRSSAWALVAGVLIGEGVHLTWFVGNDALRPAGLAQLAVASVIATVCLRRTESARVVFAITSAAALATLLAVRLIDGVFSAW